MTKYEELALLIEQKILNQEYKQQEKLPSINTLASMHHCSKATVIKCYELLEKTFNLYQTSKRALCN